MKKVLSFVLIATALMFSINAQDVTMGNPTSDTYGTKDGWKANTIVLLEPHVYENTGSEAVGIKMLDFNFLASSEAGNPITPFVAKYNSFEDHAHDLKVTPTVLAIGTTRALADYEVGGENSFTFSDEEVIVTLAAGEVLVAGIIDASIDGTVGGEGAVVEYTGAGDEGSAVFYAGGNMLKFSAILEVGSPIDTSACGNGMADGDADPVEQSGVYILTRKYSFNMTADVVEPVGVDYTAIANFKVSPTIISEGSFQVDHELSSDVAIKLHDMSGRIVLTEMLSESSSSISVNDLTSGVYFLSATSNGVVVNTQKLIVK